MRVGRRYKFFLLLPLTRPSADLSLKGRGDQVELENIVDDED